MSKLKHLKNLLTEGKITRREFMGRAVALGISLSAASSLWSTQVRAATPKRGGHLKFGHGSTTDSLDPGTFENDFELTIGFLQNNNISEIDGNGKLVPELVESWEATPDAATWTFKVRKGTEFHNGKSVDATDFVNTINFHRHKDSKSAARSLLKSVVEIKAEGKDTFVVKLNNGNADFPYIIGDYHIAILPAKGDSVDWESGIGAGPFMLEHFEPGVRALYKRNPNYWKTGRPYFDSVEVLSIIDNAARTSALKTGEIHLMDRCDLKTVHLLAKMPGISVKEVTGNAHYTIPMRTDMAPFDNNDVRLALKYSLDREALLKTVLRGHGIVGNDHPIGPANQYYAKELPTRKFDPEKAKFHLKKAGMSNLKVDLSAADAAFDGAVDAAVLYKEHAAKSGIDIKVIREPNDGYWSNVWMKKGWSMCYWGGRPTEDWMFSTAYSEGAAWNDAFWKHAGFNKLLVEARSELDQAKRREMYVELQRIVRDEGGTVVPLFNNFVFAATDKLKHGTIQGNWAQDGHKLYERWWFEA
jgi:peptide/nickel transport system substrate-binding protein